MYQLDNLPAPFPIRIPLGFFDMGRWGKVENQNALFVKSDFLADLLRKSLNLNIRLAEIRKGLSSTKAMSP